MFSHTTIVWGWVSCGLVLATYLALLGVSGWLLLRKTKI